MVRVITVHGGYVDLFSTQKLNRGDCSFEYVTNVLLQPHNVPGICTHEAEIIHKHGGGGVGVG